MGAGKNLFKKLSPIHCPKHLSSNRKNDTSQLVTCASQERLGKARRKAETKIKQRREVDSKRNPKYNNLFEQSYQQIHLTKHAMI